MPLTMEQYQKSLAQPPLCEQLKVRDLSDDLLIQLNGSFVAGYRVSGIHSYYASDQERPGRRVYQSYVRRRSRPAS